MRNIYIVEALFHIELPQFPFLKKSDFMPDGAAGVCIAFTNKRKALKFMKENGVDKKRIRKYSK